MKNKDRKAGFSAIQAEKELAAVDRMYEVCDSKVFTARLRDKLKVLILRRLEDSTK